MADYLDGARDGQQEMRVECLARELFVGHRSELASAGLQESQFEVLGHARGALCRESQLLPRSLICRDQLGNAAPRMLHVVERALQEQPDELFALLLRRGAGAVNVIHCRTR